MAMFGSRLPKHVTVDPSCNGLPAAFDSRVQTEALGLLGKSTATDRLPPREWGSMITEPYIGGGRWIGPRFTEHQSHYISLDRIMRARPTALENVLAGYKPNSVFLHTHPNPEIPVRSATTTSTLAFP